MSNWKRHIEDIDGMIDDIRESFYNCSVSELVDMIIENNYVDADSEDIINDYVNIFKGEVYE
jgi:hypothetical protein